MNVDTASTSQLLLISTIALKKAWIESRHFKYSWASSAILPNLLATKPLKPSHWTPLSFIQDLKSLYRETECWAWLGDSSLVIAITPKVCMDDPGDRNIFSPADTSSRRCTPIFCSVFLNTLSIVWSIPRIMWAQHFSILLGSTPRFCRSTSQSAAQSVIQKSISDFSSSIVEFSKYR